MGNKTNINLSDYQCEGCGHHCPLSHPHCKKGKRARKLLLASGGADMQSKFYSRKKKKNGKKIDMKKMKKAAMLEMRLSRLSEDEQKLLQQLLSKMLDDGKNGS